MPTDDESHSADPPGTTGEEPPAPHADPDYDEPGDNPLAAEDDDD